MTAAFSIGLAFTSRRMVTSMRAVAGGDLYLRPRLLVSCAAALRRQTAIPQMAMMEATRTTKLRGMPFILTCRLQSEPTTLRSHLVFNGGATVGKTECWDWSGGLDLEP